MKMKELSIDEVKKISLKILIDVDSFCKANNIKYSLAYGTLIGAIRHNGFIPWDDDIDIIMPRDDYERFFETYTSDNGYIASSPSLNNTFMFFGRVYDTKESISKPWRPQGLLKNTGVWIDIFPIDCLPENEEDYLLEYDRFISLYQKVWNKRESMLSFREIGMSPSLIFQYLRKKIKYMFFSPLKIISQYDKLLIKNNSRYTNYKGYFCNNIYKRRDRLPATIFDGYTTTLFEGCKFMIIKKYDDYLRHFYGDYMQLPPLEKRVLPHSFHKFYKK